MTDYISLVLSGFMHMHRAQRSAYVLGDWNVLTKPVRADQEKLIKIEEESTIGQLLKLWAKVKFPNFCK